MATVFLLHLMRSHKSLQTAHLSSNPQMKIFTLQLNVVLRKLQESLVVVFTQGEAEMIK